jgi:D-lyxose ketol-isomerase
MFKYGIFLTILMSVLFFACSQQQVTEKAEKPNIHFENEFFYNSDGSFNVERGKDAYIALMKYHGYPIFDGLREGLWVSDYGLGKFTELGLGAYGFINDEKGGYLGQDMYLLPNQMLPEHYHIETSKAKPKMEGWHVRYGLSYTYGEGDSTLSSHIKIPDFEKAYVSVYHETPLAVGQTAVLNRETARHWQFGGPEGAIISEYGSYHDNDAVRHSDPNIVFP